VIKTTKLLVVQQRMVPMVKMEMLESNTSLRPKISERLMMKGWTTAETRR
jgi:hypothetical protein